MTRPLGQRATCARAIAVIAARRAATAGGANAAAIRARAASCTEPSPPNTEAGEACGRILLRASPACAHPGSAPRSPAAAAGSATTTIGPVVANRTVKTSPKRD
jgi:hypothetical protein